MPVYEDWLREPLRIINNIYDSDPSNFDVKVNEYFENKLKSEKNYTSIPSLNETSIHELTPNCLVRYRCMIQDSANPEYFVSHHKLKHEFNNDFINLPSKYKDIVNYPDGYELCHEDHMIDDQQNNNAENLCQRLTFYCVPIPGEAEWVKSQAHQGLNTELQKGIDVVDEHDNEPMVNNDNKIESPTVSPIKDTNDENSSIKRTKTNGNDDTKNANSNSAINLNFPLQTQDGITCLVKVYDNFEAYKINDIVEFIGILSIDPTLAYCSQCLAQQKLQNDNQMETDNHELNNYLLESYRQTLNQCTCTQTPPSLVPRLHSIKSFHLKHDNPLMTNLYFEKSADSEIKYWNGQILNLINNLVMKGSNQMNTSQQNVSTSSIDSTNLHLLIKLRQEIVNFFQEYLLLGDSLAAEYLLMNLISGIFTRKDVTILGKLALNIFNVPNPTNSLQPNASVVNKPEIDNKNTFSSIFYKYFKELITMSHLFKLSVDTLNNSNLIPNKDYNTDKLMSGILQLPEKFHLVIDETSLNAGELKQKGLINLHGLNDVIKWQKLNYDFGFHPYEFLTNIRVLILSNTKSILASDCQFKLNPSITASQFKVEDYEANIQNFISSDTNRIFLNNLRKYLTIVSQLDYKLTESMQKIVEEDFVHMRQGGPSDKICVEDFHLLLVLARLQCLSYGKTELSLNEWNKTKLLEKERKSRLM